MQHFLLCFSDVLQSQIWKDAAASLEDASLSRMVPEVFELQLQSKAPSTVDKYKYGWMRWKKWAESKCGVPVLPAKPLHISIFITELCKSAIRTGKGISSLESIVYSIRWAHSLAGIKEFPTSHPLVSSSLEGARRKLARPVRPKEPLSVSLVQQIVDHYTASTSLAVIRFLFVLLVGFAGFFRMDELRKLVLKDIVFHADYMSVYIPKRKNDQFREGHTSIISSSGKATCPVAITRRLVGLLPQSSSSFPLIRRIVSTKAGEYFHASKGISYSTLREEFKKYVKPFVEDISLYGTHSIKSGAASNPACRNISGDLLDLHAGWKNSSSKHRYIKHSISERLDVSRSIAL